MRDTVFEDTVFGGPIFGESPSGGPADDPFADLPGVTALPQNPVIVDDFDPAEDILVIALEDTGAEAVIETRPTRDRRGTGRCLRAEPVAARRPCSLCISQPLPAHVSAAVAPCRINAPALHPRDISQQRCKRRSPDVG